MRTRASYSSHLGQRGWSGGVRGTEGNRRLVTAKCGEKLPIHASKRRRAPSTNSISTSVDNQSAYAALEIIFNSQFTLFIEIVMEQTDAGFCCKTLPYHGPLQINILHVYNGPDRPSVSRRIPTPVNCGRTLKICVGNISLFMEAPPIPGLGVLSRCIWLARLSRSFVLKLQCNFP